MRRIAWIVPFAHGLLLGLVAGGLAVAVSATALRRGERWARRVLWLLPRQALSDLALLGASGAPRLPLLRVVSGGQTGADRGALDAAIALGLDHGGWCPPGRAAEDGTIPPRYALREAPADRSSDAPDVPRSLRTELNVRDSDATLVVRPAGAPPDPGTELTLCCAARHGRPVLVCDPADARAFARVRGWLDALEIRTLNVAGPSESRVPGIGAAARRVLEAALAR